MLELLPLWSMMSSAAAVVVKEQGEEGEGQADWSHRWNHCELAHGYCPRTLWVMTAAGGNELQAIINRCNILHYTYNYTCSSTQTSSITFQAISSTCT